MKKLLLIISFGLLLTSCFKTDSEGNAFIFENGNQMAFRLRIENVTSSTVYYGAYNTVATTSNTDVTPFSNNSYWCFKKVQLQQESGGWSTDNVSLYVNGPSVATSSSLNSELNYSVSPGDTIVFSLNCSSCTNLTGYLIVELDDCNN